MKLAISTAKYEKRRFSRMSGCKMMVVLLCVVCSTSALSDAQWKPALDIVGGDAIDITKVPYQAAALDPGTGFLVCGASIISRNHLLLAGHCCDGELNFRVGSNNYTQGGTLIGSRRTIIHPKYNNNGLYPDYDACIVETSKPFNFGPKIQPLAIAKYTPEPDDMVMVAGWGVTETGVASTVLRSVLVPVTNSTYCQRAYLFVTDMDNFICAGAEGKDSCYGDSGGALTWRRKLVGIVSFGNRCGLQGFPGVYTNVLSPEIREFIRNVTGV